MRKKVMLILSLVFLLTILPVSQNDVTYAFNEYEIVPLWKNINFSNVTISNSGNTIYLEARVISKINGNRINATIFLEKYSNGRWIPVASWPVSGTGSIISNKNYSGFSGNRYRARLNATVNGETATAYSSSIQL